MSLYMLHPYTFILGGSAAIVFFYYYSNRWGTKAGRLGAALAVFFCGCAAAQIEIMQGTHREVIDRDKESRLYIDVSDSIPIELGELFLEVAKKNAAITEIIPFAGSVGAPILGDGASVSFQKLRSKFSPEDLHSTNLEPVILKMCNLTIGTRAILATDGEETKGSFERALVNCNTEAAVNILSVPRPPSIDEFTITNLNVPTHVDLSVQPKIQVSIKNNRSIVQSARLKVSINGEQIGNESPTLSPGRGKTFFFKGPALKAQDGRLEVLAQLVGGGGEILSSKRAYIRPKPTNAVVLVSKNEEQSTWIKSSLEQNSFTVIERRPDALTKKDLQEENTRGIILNNVPFKDIRSFDATIKEMVEREGFGLAMFGGDSSFGLGGYQNSEIAKILPVEVIPPEAEQKRVNIAVQLILDKSASMNQGEKIEFARESAREVVRNLKPEDYIGVIGFDATPFIAVRIGRVGDIRQEALDKISRIYPAQSTNLLPALDEARRGLARVESGRKHIIVLTDGRLPDSGPYYPEFVRQLRLEGVTMSTVLIGSEVDVSLLKEMARIGGGAFYQTSDVRSLPRIFIADVKTSTGNPNLNEGNEFLPRRQARLQSTSISELPPIRGYAETKKKDTATLEFTVDGNKGTVPLLASMDVGSGRSVAYTSDLYGKWSGVWAQWPKTQNFIADLVKYVTKVSSEQKPELIARSFFEKGKVVFEVTAFGSLKGAVTGIVEDKDKKQGEIIIPKEIAQRRYRFEVTPPSPGPLSLVLYQSGDHESRLDSFTYDVTKEEIASDERYKGINEYNLERLRAGVSYKGYDSKNKGTPYPVKESPRKVVTDYIFLLTAMVCYLFSVLRRERMLGKMGSRYEA